MMRRVLLVALLAAAGSPVLAKSLHWRDLDVTARLDAAGVLHVVERQAIVFDGDWNGGERTFRVGGGQSMDFESISRVENGVEKPLTLGDLDQVDHYGFTSPNVLRWRSRLPSDPPFQNKEITYVLAYSLSGVLRSLGGRYLLNHDFAFTERPGTIDHFALRFDLDPVWRGATSPIILERGRLPIGESVVVLLKLQFTGAGAPPPANTSVRTIDDVRDLLNDIIHNNEVPKGTLMIVTLLAIGLLVVIGDFIRVERAKGRFASLVAPETIDEAWLKKNLFVISPEAAAEAIDGKSGPAEVAAMLARMTQEKKIATHVENRRVLLISRPVLCMNLLVDRKTLSDPEKQLVGALFDAGDTTDTDAVRSRYSGRGFNPAALVSPGVVDELKKIPGWDAPAPPQWKQPLILFGISVALLIVAATQGRNDLVFVLIFGIANFVFGVFAAAAAAANARALTAVAWRAFQPLLFIAPILIDTIAAALLAGRLDLHLLTVVAMCVWALSLTKVAFDRLRSPDSPQRIAFRKRLMSARNYFIAELRSPEPRLRDDWYPYFLAFGLGQHVDRWFGAHGARATTSDSFMSSPGSSTSDSLSSASSGFTGGGGAFGGAGATGGWAAAAAIIGAGVAEPSSSGSGSDGGGGGSSSSGGGGGGGW